ncbi:copper amine oxidase 1 [Purpureocillium lilacinum]|uniref:Amine oxidase n=3 Tax=Purpureocillium lilacinum TaxID=33203 RepID=A0A179H727_PURLI|nr:copper amine oxidase 1 [Purpureocillium lilacinum]KAK4086699.1 hypothetical protein Purlil1_8864 [Purpureocillium lilacinum]OAQ85967.1 copper amine oxidase 1 [Purpureocillium lilacinum]OAQ93927.1 copper amine oxidase 1 [Purpureocillium lilacinum]GJN67751.1 hypothetical protein PLICBS_001779 [Purpureocillium lilacinum]
MAITHPLDPLQPQELRLAVSLLKDSLPGIPLRFKTIEVQEPAKKDVVPYVEAERLGELLPQAPARIVHVLFHRQDTGAHCHALINVDNSCIISQGDLPEHSQSHADVDEMVEIEKICLEHPAVIAEIEKLRLPAGVKVCVDPWIYGTDDPNERRRLFQCLVYLSTVDHPQANHYSIPCTFSPVFNGVTKELVRIDYLPTGTEHATAETQPWTPVPAVEYAHDLLGTPLRTDLKPYIVQQPEGPSFQINGQVVSWQKWRFRVGFNYRDGMVLYNVTFDGRNVFYRLSVSELTVPYGDPRAPFHRRHPFDIGDLGLGIICNQLQLGCDCLGHIKYFDGFRPDSHGEAVCIKNAICLHEQDAGLLYKHTNYRNNQATTVRNRQLAVQMMVTASNYEYIFAWILDQAGGIELEVRATGIMSTIPVDDAGGSSLPWATNVGPGVAAPNHQHIIAVRIDPAIDGFNNTVVYEDSVLMPDSADVPNPYGCGYIAKTSVIEKSGHADTNTDTARVFKIRNDSILNRVSGAPVAYKVQTLATQPIIAAPGSIHRKRTGFAEHAVWVTKYRDGELYAAGEYTNQSLESDGVENWAARDEDVVDTDVVFWHTFSLTHNPRPEDFPVMPAERISVHLKPSGFHEKNPALDVPPSHQSFNKSACHL